MALVSDDKEDVACDVGVRVSSTIDDSGEDAGSRGHVFSRGIRLLTQLVAPTSKHHSLRMHLITINISEARNSVIRAEHSLGTERVWGIVSRPASYQFSSTILGTGNFHNTTSSYLGRN